MAIYRIRNWSTIFENCESRKLKSLKWVSMPNKMNTQGYTALIDHPNGPAHFGAWCALVEICSAREPKESRGVLPEADGTIGGISRVLGRISRMPQKLFEELLPRLLTDPEIQWIEMDTVESGKIPDAPGKNPDASGDGGKNLGTEGKGRDNITREETTPLSPPAPNGADIHTRSSSRLRTTDQIRHALGERLPWWENFWKVYPCHAGMKPAMDAFERRIKTHDQAAAAYKGAKAYAERIAQDPTAKVKYAQGWINDERWTDEGDSAPRSKQRNPTVPMESLPSGTKIWDPVSREEIIR